MTLGAALHASCTLFTNACSGELIEIPGKGVKVRSLRLRGLLSYECRDKQ